ncbi:PucR family transcriptional regulator [Actinomadura atramentaria]|uniref:PucR family transcriptional regulator n=1 Tax=Actinomadura atramentaria TaxID=1990 RepID=UPI00036CB63C|nr:PucR family transcriptional regulator [Actinomadura atramentaria]
MTRTLDPVAASAAGAASSLPRRLAQLMRPELPSLCDEIVAEIRKAIPEYAPPGDGPYDHAYDQVLHASVRQSLTAFTDRVGGTPGGAASHREAARRLGEYEAMEGRSLDSLQAAYRIGGQVAWRRVMKVAPRYDISSTVMSRLADALFSFMDELAALSLEGYLAARAHPVAALDERRRRLLRILLDGAAGPGPALVEMAEAAGWTVPEQVTLVALRPGPGQVRTVLDDDLLVDLDDAEPHLLLPGPPTEERAAMLATAFPGRRLAIGTAVPLARAADSLRWARQALHLAEEGVLEVDGPIVRCDDHLVTLWLMADPALLEQLAHQVLGVLPAMTPGQQDRLTETLRTWLVTRGTAAEIAARLHIHPQTVRYRMRKIEQTLGPELADPDARFGIEAVLRAMELRERARKAHSRSGGRSGAPGAAGAARSGGRGVPPNLPAAARARRGAVPHAVVTPRVPRRRG